MKHHESRDLKAANDRHIKKLQRLAQFRARTQPTRERVRQEWQARGGLRSW